MCVHVCVHVCAHVRVHVYVCVCARAHVYVCVCVYTHTHTLCGKHKEPSALLTLLQYPPSLSLSLYPLSSATPPLFPLVGPLLPQRHRRSVCRCEHLDAEPPTVLPRLRFHPALTIQMPHHDAVTTLGAALAGQAPAAAQAHQAEHQAAGRRARGAWRAAEPTSRGGHPAAVPRPS